MFVAQDIACSSKCLQCTSSLLRICDEILKMSFPDWLLDTLGIAYVVIYPFRTNEQGILFLVCNADNSVAFINFLFSVEKHLYILLIWKRSYLFIAAPTLLSSWQHMLPEGIYFKPNLCKIGEEFLFTSRCSAFLEETKHCCVLPELVSWYQHYHLSWSPGFKLISVKKYLASFKDLPQSRDLGVSTRFDKAVLLWRTGQGSYVFPFIIFSCFLTTCSFNLSCLHSYLFNKQLSSVSLCKALSSIFELLLTSSQKMHPSQGNQCLS